MTYPEYLSCAEKHLSGCIELFASYKEGSKNEMQVWLEIYYLSGYVLEGLTVYSAYKRNGWEEGISIKKDNTEFVNRTGLKFYPWGPSDEKNGKTIEERKARPAARAVSTATISKK